MAERCLTCLGWGMTVKDCTCEEWEVCSVCGGCGCEGRHGDESLGKCIPLRERLVRNDAEAEEGPISVPGKPYKKLTN